MEIKAIKIENIGKQNKLNPEEQKLKSACQQFETILAQQMLTAMQGSTKMFGSGFGGEYFQGLFQEQLAKQLSENELGLAKVLFEQLRKSVI